MSPDFFLKGLLTGFLLAAPIGPIGILCIRGVLLYGRRHGFIIGVSGACGDIIYSTAAAFGVKLIFDFVVSHQPAMRLAGGLMLIGAGVFTYLSRSGSSLNEPRIIGEKGIFASTFLLALTNPLTLFGYAAAFSALGVNNILSEFLSVALLVGGVFCGSLLWFSFLVWFAQRFRQKVTARGIGIINKIVGLMLILFGTISLIMGLRAIEKL